MAGKTMIKFLAKDFPLETIKADILKSLSQRNFEAEALLGHLPFKDYQVEIALNDLITGGQVVSYWTDSGAFQRKFYALTEKFNREQPVVQFCASGEAIDALGEINLTTRQERRQSAVQPPAKDGFR